MYIYKKLDYLYYADDDDYDANFPNYVASQRNEELQHKVIIVQVGDDPTLTIKNNQSSPFRNVIYIPEHDYKSNKLPQFINKNIANITSFTDIILYEMSVFTDKIKISNRKQPYNDVAGKNGLYRKYTNVYEGVIDINNPDMYTTFAGTHKMLWHGGFTANNAQNTVQENNSIINYNLTLDYANINLTITSDNNFNLLSTNYLYNLGDVNITTLTDGQTLVFNEANNQWENANGGGGGGAGVTSILAGDRITIDPPNGTGAVTVTSSVQAFRQLSDVNATPIPSNNGDTLKYDSTSDKWVICSNIFDSAAGVGIRGIGKSVLISQPSLANLGDLTIESLFNPINIKATSNNPINFVTVNNVESINNKLRITGADENVYKDRITDGNDLVTKLYVDTFKPPHTLNDHTDVNHAATGGETLHYNNLTSNWEHVPEIVVSPSTRDITISKGGVPALRTGGGFNIFGIQTLAPSVLTGTTVDINSTGANVRIGGSLSVNNYATAVLADPIENGVVTVKALRDEIASTAPNGHTLGSHTDVENTTVGGRLLFLNNATNEWQGTGRITVDAANNDNVTISSSATGRLFVRSATTNVISTENADGDILIGELSSDLVINGEAINMFSTTSFQVDVGVGNTDFLLRQGGKTAQDYSDDARADLQGNAIPNMIAVRDEIGLLAPVPALDGLTDVNASAPAVGDILTWDGTGDWVAAPPAAPPPPSIALDDITNVDAPAPSDLEVLTFNTASGNWIAQPVPAPTGVVKWGTNTEGSFPGQDAIIRNNGGRFCFEAGGTRFITARDGWSMDFGDTNKQVGCSLNGSGIRAFADTDVLYECTGTTGVLGFALPANGTGEVAFPVGDGPNSYLRYGGLELVFGVREDAATIAQKIENSGNGNAIPNYTCITNAIANIAPPSLALNDLTDVTDTSGAFSGEILTRGATDWVNTPEFRVDPSSRNVTMITTGTILARGTDEVMVQSLANNINIIADTGVINLTVGASNTVQIGAVAATYAALCVGNPSAVPNVQYITDQLVGITVPTVLNDLTDVETTATPNNQFLWFNSTTNLWEASPRITVDPASNENIRINAVGTGTIQVDDAIAGNVLSTAGSGTLSVGSATRDVNIDALASVVTVAGNVTVTSGATTSITSTNEFVSIATSIILTDITNARNAFNYDGASNVIDIGDASVGQLRLNSIESSIRGSTSGTVGASSGGTNTNLIVTPATVTLTSNSSTIQYVFEAGSDATSLVRIDSNQLKTPVQYSADVRAFADGTPVPNRQFVNEELDRSRAYFAMEGNATASGGTQNQIHNIKGTFTNVSLKDFTAVADNGYQYTGTETKFFDIQYSATPITSSNDRTIKIYFYLNPDNATLNPSIGGRIIGSTGTCITRTAINDTDMCSGSFGVTLATNHIIRAYVTNTENNDSTTLVDFSVCVRKIN